MCKGDRRAVPGQTAVAQGDFPSPGEPRMQEWSRPRQGHPEDPRCVWPPHVFRCASHWTGRPPEGQDGATLAPLCLARGQNKAGPSWTRRKHLSSARVSREGPQALPRPVPFKPR